jgi:hypothetical protein
MRADRKAALEASGLLEEDEEDDDPEGFYPTSLPPRWAGHQCAPLC